MPFETPQVIPFTKSAIEALDEALVGCYGIYRARNARGPADQGEWVYVGKGRVRDRLLSHERGDNPCILPKAPTHVKVEATRNPDAREKALILEFNPSCNQKVG